ncbi:MAG: LptF/LptG family permease, partial [Mesorhizobium sp.]
MSGDTAFEPGRPRAAVAPTRYLWSVGINVVLVLLAVCAVSCGIYMIERTVGILDIALRYHFSVGNFFGLVVLQLPMLAEFALPVACYAAAHFVLLARRERREFVILAAAGVSPTALVLPILVAAGASGLLSIFFTDTISPAATRAYRLIETDGRAHVLSSQLPANRFFIGPGAVLYVGQGRNAGDSTVRLFQRSGTENSTILSSDCASPQTSDGQIRLRLCDGDVYVFQRPIESGERPVHLNVGETIYPFNASTVLEGRTSAAAPAMSVRELIAGKGESADDAAEGISRLLSALACLLAASLAIVTVAYTTANTRILTFLGGSVGMFALMALRNPLAQL